jgi:hypothetical protein
MQTYNAFFARELLKLLEEQINERTKILGNGHGVTDFTDYRHKVGIITGLHLVIDELFPQAQENCDRNQRGRQ